jgi:MFS family permease
MNTWGYIASYGLFQAYYTSTLDRPPADIAWIGSIQLFLTFFVGALIGRFTDAGFLRTILLCGTLMITLGAFAASFATQYWHLILSQGLCNGIGNGCLVTPAVSVVSTYFRQRRSLAIGIINCGGATGGIIFPAMARQLIPSVGFGWTMRAIGFVQFSTLLCACLGLRSRLQPRSMSKGFGLTHFMGLDFTIFTAGTFFVSGLPMLA